MPRQKSKEKDGKGGEVPVILTMNDTMAAFVFRRSL